MYARALATTMASERLSALTVSGRQPRTAGEGQLGRCPLAPAIRRSFDVPSQRYQAGSGMHATTSPDQHVLSRPAQRRGTLLATAFSAATYKTMAAHELRNTSGLAPIRWYVQAEALDAKLVDTTEKTTEKGEVSDPGLVEAHLDDR